MRDPSHDEMWYSFNEPQLRSTLKQKMGDSATMNVDDMITFAWMIFKEGVKAGVSFQAQEESPASFQTVH